MFLNKISPTKFKMYEECHLKYKYQYVEKLPGIFNEGSNTNALQFGSYIHRIFELGYQCKTVDELHAIAEEVRDNYEFEGYGKRKIANCVNNFFEFNKGLNETVGVEHRFEAEVDSFTINGIIDRVIIGEEGGILVIDYKTSKRMSKPSDLYSDPQMLMYTYAAHQIYRVPYSKITVAHYYPTQNKLVSVRIPKGRVENFINRKLKEMVWEVRKKKKNDFRAMHNNFCNWCNFKDICTDFHSQCEIDKTLLESKDKIAEAKEASKAYWAKQDEEEKAKKEKPLDV